MWESVRAGIQCGDEVAAAAALAKKAVLDARRLFMIWSPAMAEELR